MSSAMSRKVIVNQSCLCRPSSPSSAAAGSAPAAISRNAPKCASSTSSRLLPNGLRKIGNVSSSQCAIVDIWPVMNRMPVSTSSAPIAFSTLCMCCLKPRRPAEEPAGEQRGEHEGKSDAQRIDRQQHGAACRRPFRARHEQDRRQHRADAGRPAEGEGQAHDIGADEAGGLPAPPERAPRGKAARSGRRRGNAAPSR